MVNRPCRFFPLKSRRVFVSVISAVSLLRFQPINEIESKSFTNDVSYSSQNVISFSLYGNEDRYTGGAVVNAILAQDIYPEWQVRIYHDNSVPEVVLADLASMSNVELVNMSSSPPSSNPWTWRFLVALDPEVNAYIIRDIDSRLNLREKAAVFEWLEGSNATFHIMHDHPAHCAMPMQAGMWGGRSILPQVEMIVYPPEMLGNFSGHWDDAEKLERHVWPIVRQDVLHHDSFCCGKFNETIQSRPFPTKREDGTGEHVGGVYLPVLKGKLRDRDKTTLLDAIKNRGECNKPRRRKIPFTSQGGNRVSSYIYDELLNEVNNKIGTFVEFGCADGVTNSNTYPFEKYLGWTGLCIEPNYANYLKASRTRKNAIFALVTGHPGNFTYAQMSGKCDQHSGVIEFYSPQYIKIMEECEKMGLVELVPLEGIPLDILLEKNNFTHVDWISVDCEGCEASFITGFNFTKWGVQILNYEPNTAAKLHTSEIEGALKKYGFEFDQVLQDVIWRQPGSFKLG